MLMAGVAVLTRPKNSSMIFGGCPAAGITFGFVMIRDMAELTIKACPVSTCVALGWAKRPEPPYPGSGRRGQGPARDRPRWPAVAMADWVRQSKGD
jgi:hypothetical protein